MTPVWLITEGFKEHDYDTYIDFCEEHPRNAEVEEWDEVDLDLEDNDCTVWALANAADMHYAEAHSILERFGRQPRRGYLPFKEFCDYFFEPQLSLGPLQYRRWAPKAAKLKNWLLFHQFLQLHPHGAFIVGVRRHVLAVRNGQTLDESPCEARKRVTSAWLVTSEAVARLRHFMDHTSTADITQLAATFQRSVETELNLHLAGNTLS